MQNGNRRGQQDGLHLCDTPGDERLHALRIADSSAVHVSEKGACKVRIRSCESAEAVYNLLVVLKVVVVGLDQLVASCLARCLFGQAQNLRIYLIATGAHPVDHLHGG
ncbi:hypothetical protein D3C85_1546040 [compost metagenome]